MFRFLLLVLALFSLLHDGQSDCIALDQPCHQLPGATPCCSDSYCTYNLICSPIGARREPGYKPQFPSISGRTRR